MTDDPWAGIPTAEPNPHRPGTPAHDDWDRATRERLAHADGWQHPERGILLPPLPEFPTKRLPPVLCAMAEAASAEVQTPVGMAAMLCLAVAASTVAGKIEVVGRAGHVEQLPLWVFIAANSAERKTPVFNLLRAPLIAYELEHQRANEMARKQAQFQLKVIEGQISALEKKAIKGGSAGIAAEVEAAFMALEDLKIPPRMQLWVSSPTPEAVHYLLSEHDGRMAVFADEGGLFGIIGGRYAGKSGGADIDPFLSGYVGSPLRAPRVTAERKNVAAAFLTMGFAVQPSVLSDLGAVAGVEERGLIGRFLFAFPESRIGSRPYDVSEPVPADIQRAYGELITQWAALPAPPTRHRLILAPDAYRAYADFHDRIESRMKEGKGDLEFIGSWGGKIAGTALRIAAILHIFEHDDAIDRSIPMEAVLNAAAITEDYLVPHGLAAFRVLRGGAAKSTTARLVAWIAKKQLPHFTLNHAFKQLSGGAGGTVQSKADVLPAIDALLEGGYIREGKAGRSDSVLYEVNPLWDYS